MSGVHDCIARRHHYSSTSVSRAVCRIFDPDRHAMKNVENLIILKRYHEDLVELTSSDIQEGNEA